ncbi:hypothetical protein G6F68_016662 [Rhizopus microsporus]|nr:hypothetical protein G6F68_016662 [Rhizopus microsporus]
MTPDCASCTAWKCCCACSVIQSRSSGLAERLPSGAPAARARPCSASLSNPDSPTAITSTCKSAAACARWRTASRLPASALSVSNSKVPPARSAASTCAANAIAPAASRPCGPIRSDANA